MQEMFPLLSQSHFADELTDSSGISLSNVTENTDFPVFPAKDRLELIARKHDRSKRSSQLQDKTSEKQEHGQFTPIFPRIDFTQKKIEKEKTKMKSDYRLSPLPKIQLPVISAVPKTVGKYQLRVNVVPGQSLPSRGPQKPVSPPPATQYLMREQFRRERYHQSPGFNEADLTRIFDHYSISRYLSSPESRPEPFYDDSSRSLGFTENKSLPSLRYNINKKTNKTKSCNKSSKLVWIPRLSQWITEDQNRPIQYLKLGGGVNMNLRRQPICCGYHDFFHKNLNWEVRKWKPSPCPRYLHHHHYQQQQQQLHTKKVVFPSTLDAGKKRKPPTIPLDPFTSKNERNMKRPWLDKPMPATVKQRQPSVHLVLPHEGDDVYAYHWMVDNSTMTEDSSSDMLSVSTSFYSTPPVIFKVPNKPLQVKKMTKIDMVDKACDVMTPYSSTSREHSYCTEDADNKEDFDKLEDLSQLSPVVNHDDFNKDASSRHFTNFVLPTTPLPPLKTEEDTIIPKLLENENNSVELDGAVEVPCLEDESDKRNTVLPFNGFGKESKPYQVFYEKSDDACAEEETPESTDDAYSGTSVVDSEEGHQKITESAEFSNTQSSPMPMQKSKAKPPSPRLLIPPFKLIKEDGESNTSMKRDTLAKENDIVVPLPTLVDRPVISKSDKPSRKAIAIHSSSPTLRKKRGKIVRDTTMTDEINRAKLAEERRKRAKERFEKLKQERIVVPPSNSESPLENFEDGDFLNKFSILNSNKVEAFRRIFDSVDNDQDGYLDCEELLLAIQKVLPDDCLKESHINHIYRLLDLANHDILTKKTGFTLFSIIASLAQKIVNLNDFMQNLIDRFDFQSLDTKMWKARQLFNHYVDDAEAQTISMKSLWIELKSGGISTTHENKIRDSLKHLPHLDVLDFMTYLPLFTFTYSHAVKHPLREEIF